MIYFATMLAVFWSTGCVLIPLWATWGAWNEGDKPIAAACLFIGWPIGCLLATLPWAFFFQTQSPDLATLKKNEWVCSASHLVTTTTYVKSGSVMTPITSTHRVCDQYNRTGA